MNNLSLKLILDMVDKITAPARAMTTRMAAMLKTVTDGAKKLGDQLDKIGKKMTSIGGFLTTRLSLPILGFGGLAIRSAGQVEELVEQLTHLAGSADKATAYVNGLQGYIDRFGLADVGEAVTQLEMAGYSLEEINKRLNLMGDIAAGSRQPLAAITDQYIALRKAGKLSDGDLTAMQKARIPIVQELARQLGKSEKQIYNMAAAGKITFNDYRKALQGLTEEGGRFAGKMESRGKTINGIFNELKNTLSSAFAGIGMELWEQLDIGAKVKTLAEGVRSLAESFMALPAPVKNTIVWIALIMAAIGPVVLLIGNFIIGIAGLLIVFAKIPAAFAIAAKAFGVLLAVGDGLALLLLKLPKALFALELALKSVFTIIMANPIGLIITAIVALGVAAYMLIKHWDKVKEFFSGFWDGLESAFKAGVAGVLEVLQPLLDAVNFLVAAPIEMVRNAAGVVKTGWNKVFGEEQPAAGTMPSPAPASTAPLLRHGNANGRVDAGGTIKIEVDDRRVRVADARPNDSRIQLQPQATGAIMGGW